MLINDLHLKEIIQSLESLRNELKQNAKVGKTDVSKAAENLVKQLLNTTYALHLENINKTIPNYPAIDLEDIEKQICYQVTLQSDKKRLKIRSVSSLSTNSTELIENLKYLS